MRKITMTLVLFIFVVQAMVAQTTITGNITSAADGSSVPGATVRAKGISGVGTISDMDGKYTLTVPANAEILVFSFVGMKTQEVAIAGQKVINVKMENDAQTLGDVVVTALGIVRQPKELGYAISKVDNELLTQAKTVNVTSSLSGKVAGLQINTVNNAVGSNDARITLRGSRSLMGNNQALLVLDGVPTSLSYINTINPNDIENMTILKGANAAALYGSEAANGVIQIQTKKGTKGQVRVEFNHTTTFETVSFMPKLQTRFGSGSGTDANGYPVYAAYENQNYGPEYNGSMVNLGFPVLINGKPVQQQIVYQDNSKSKTDFWNTGVTVQNMLSYSGGDEKSQYYLSAQDAIITGVVPDDEARRSTISFNAQRQSGKLHFNTKVAYTFSSKNVAGTSQYQDRSVYWMIMNTPNGIPLTDYKDVKNNPYADQNGYFNAYYENPYSVIDYSRDKDRTDYVVGLVEAEMKILPELTALARSSITYSNMTYETTKAAVRFSDYAKNLSGRSISSSDFNGQDFEGSNVIRRWTNDFIMTYKKKFGTVDVTAIGGFTNRESYQKLMDIGSNSLKIDGYYNINNRVGDASKLTSSWNKYRSVGVYADLTLGYKDYLFVHATGRNDWTSLLADGNNSYFYPGVDVSFIFSDFIPLGIQDIFSFGKARAGITQVGTLNVNPYSLENVFVLGSNNNSSGTDTRRGYANFPYGSLTSFTTSNRLNNPNLKPEMTLSKEVGLELGFLNSKINLTLTAYENSTKDQTVPVQIPNSSGYISTNINTGEVLGRGFESELKANILDNKNGFSWEIGANFTYQTSKVVSITSDLDEIQLGGYTTGSGVYATVGDLYPMIKNLDFLRDPNGRIVVDAVTGYPKANSNPTYAGCSSPTHIIGLNTQLKYKGFTLGISAEYRHGAVIWNDIADALTFTGTGWLTATNGRQRFVFPNSVYESGRDAKGNPIYAQNTNIATSTGGVEFWTNVMNNTERFTVTSADFWKLRELTLSYEVPVSVLPKFIKKAQLGLVARNVLTILPKSNIYTDPEFSMDNGNAVGLTTINQTPPTRTFGFNLSINF
jgi:TonB-linked SusC/RagA family outer membrane protein